MKKHRPREVNSVVLDQTAHESRVSTHSMGAPTAAIQCTTPDIVGMLGAQSPWAQHKALLHTNGDAGGIKTPYPLGV